MSDLHTGQVPTEEEVKTDEQETPAAEHQEDAEDTPTQSGSDSETKPEQSGQDTAPSVPGSDLSSGQV